MQKKNIKGKKWIKKSKCNNHGCHASWTKILGIEKAGSIEVPDCGYGMNGSRCLLEWIRLAMMTIPHSC